MIYNQVEVNEKINELKIESAKIIEEFKIYFNTAEPISIEYEAVSTPLGWCIDAYLLFGETILRQYNVPELANLDLNNMILNRMIQLRGE